MFGPKMTQLESKKKKRAQAIALKGCT